MKNTNKKARIILAENIKKIREKKGLTQEGLSFLSGLHRTYISSIERCERNVSIDAIEKISIALKTPLSKLVEE